MKCLILAAGLGTRLREVSPSKPLTPIGGTPLIAHVVERASAGGATAFVVVTGYEAERVEAFLAGLDAPVQCVRTPDWSRPNGYSVLAGTEAIAGDYLLMMSDHLFEPEIVAGLLAAPRADAGLTLAVDRNLSGPLLDLDDATKVELAEDARIVRIGKALASFDAIDTGIFLATPELAEAIRADVAAGGSGSLSEGVQRLAEAGRAATFDIGRSRWVDVDSPEMLRLAEALIRGSAA
jgi:choline kinase